MKKLLVLTAGVLFSTLVFANSTVDPKGSSVGIMNSGTDLIKLFYKSVKTGDVSVSILNDKDEVVYTEKITNSEGFMRPYNFKNLPAGKYTIQVENEEGLQIQTISYGISQAETRVAISKIPSKEGRYLISGYSPTGEKINTVIYDEDGAIIHQDTHFVNGKFSQVYNMSSIEGKFTIEVGDANGTLQSFNK